MRTTRLARVALFGCLIVPAVRAQPAPREYRPAIMVTVPVWHGFAVLLQEEQHLSMHDLAHTDHLRGVGLLSPSFRYGSLAIEVREVRRTNGLIEHRWIPTVHSLVEAGGGMELRNRARVEFRDVAGAWSRRYQDRVTLLRPIDVLGTSYAPYVHYELSYDTRFGVLNRREGAVGVRVPVGRGASVDSFLMRQTDTRRDIEAIVAAGMILRVAL